MELERDLMDKFLTYLLEHGFPEESLLTEYKAGRGRVDLAVIDTTTQLPIMLFELKSRKRRDFVRMGTDQLRRYVQELNLPEEIPTYLVFPKDVDPFFEVIEVDANISNLDVAEYKSVKSIDYNLQRKARLAEKANKAEKKKEEVVDRFSLVSWILAGILFGIGVGSKIWSFTLSATDLTLLGAIIGLIIAPFASKIKFWGIEFERFRKAKNK
ncbi:hypothetical protein QBE53_10485 [Vallitaleaceae bacterium 9-2]